jgi:hypothetical protein
MGVRTCIDDNEIGTIGARRLNTVNQRTFVIALIGGQCGPQAPGQGNEVSLDLWQRRMAVQMRLAQTEQV